MKGFPGTLLFPFPLKLWLTLSKQSPNKQILLFFVPEESQPTEHFEHPIEKLLS